MILMETYNIYMRARKQIPYVAPETEWEEIRLEKDFLGTNDVTAPGARFNFHFKE